LSLIGRERELAELAAAFEAAEAGRGGLVLLTGEAGIGKTTLADAFTSTAQARGARLAWGRAWEAGGAPAFWPWVEVLRELFAAVDLTGEAARAVGSSLAVVGEIVPELAAPDVPRPPELAPAQARFRLFDAVGALLRWSARDQTLVIVLDDLHAADPATLSLLQFAVRSLTRSRVLLVGTARDVEARLTPEVAGDLARIAREGRYLVLERLGRGEVAAWLDAAGDGGGDGGRLADLLYRRTEGNPLFLVETYRLLRADPQRSTAALPDGVREVIAARLRLVTDECRRLLDSAAILGRTVDLHLLAAMTGASVAGLRAGLAGAVDAELVGEPVGDHCAFTHILISDVLCAALEPERRAALHRDAARALIERDASDPAAPLTDLVHHLFAAGAPDAVDWARRAAARAAQRLAFEHAVGFLERALAALPAAEDSLDRFDLLLELAGARVRAGLGPAARAASRTAADLARRLGDPERLARAALAYGEVFVFALVDPVLVELLEAALAGLPAGDSELRARLLARLAAARQPAVDPEPPMQIAREAIAMAERVAGPAARLAVLQAASSALLYFAEPDECMRHNRRLVELARGEGDRARALRGHLRLVFDHLEANDPVGADAAIAACEGLARELGHPAYGWQIPLLRAMRAVMDGRFAEAEELADRARALAERVDDPNRALALAAHRLGHLSAIGRSDAIELEAPALLAVVDRVADVLYSVSVAAMIWTRAGRLDRARAALGQLPPGVGWARGRKMAGWLAEAAVAVGDAGLAANLVDVVSTVAARNHVWGAGTFVCEDSLARPLGMAASLAGQHAIALEALENAMARARVLAAPPLTARVELELAIALVRTGEEAHRERARALLDSAQATADRLGLVGLGDAAGAQRDRMTPAPPARPEPPQVRPVPTAIGFSLERDGEVWAVGWGGSLFRVQDSRGMQILAHLVAHPGQEFHVTDLSAPAGAPGHVEDAGEVLDQEAIASYRRRLEEVKEELDEAERWNDEGRQSRLREEVEFLAAELGRAVGLGGRRRKAGSSSEKARVNVKRRLSHAIGKIAEHSSGLGAHLEWAVKTGLFCSYRPG
jgi:hypothetical protein